MSTRSRAVGARHVAAICELRTPHDVPTRHSRLVFSMRRTILLEFSTSRLPNKFTSQPRRRMGIRSESKILAETSTHFVAAFCALCFAVRTSQFRGTQGSSGTPDLACARPAKPPNSSLP